MESEILEFGMDDKELESHPTIYRPDFLVGKVAVISGGGSGIGRAAAWLFARLGARVVICGRKLEKLKSVAASLKKVGLEAQPIVCNIRDDESIEAMFSKVENLFGGCDILVNSAGGQYPQPAIDFTIKGWNAVIETNLTGTWLMMQTAARYWRKSSRPGSIVNIVTVVERGQPGIAHSCAARAGVIALSKTVAIEWAPDKIRVNCIGPGPIDTEGQRVYTEETRNRSARSNPMMRFGDSFDIAEAIIFLAAESGKFITGENLIIDGGSQLWGEFWVGEKPEYFK